MIEFGAHKVPLEPGAGREQRVRRARAMLFRVLNMKTTVAVVGSGCTIPLGYPSWQEFVAKLLNDVADTLDLEARKSLPRAAEEAERLRAYHAKLQGREADSEQLMFYISAVQKAAGIRSWSNERNPYFRFFEETFDKAPNPAASSNPCKALVALPIYRFVTTNYDFALEQAIEKARDRDGKRQLKSAYLRGAESALSFTQLPKYAKQHIRFALARGVENRDMVFHCHGRWDDPESIIASEADYQKWYVADSEGAGPAFRQTMDLLFSSNPLLFVGYGLREPDLLRPLRQHGAFDPTRKSSRPVFALLGVRGEEDLPSEEMLFERYGVHVIPFDIENIEKRARQLPEEKRKAWIEKERAAALCTELERLQVEFREASAEWLMKPKVRKATAIPGNGRVFYSPRFGSKTIDLLGKSPAARRLDELVKVVLDKPRIVGLIGSGGTAKTWHALELVRSLQKRPRKIFGKIVYWNAHYANEGVTALDMILDFLESGSRGTGTREARLLSCLQKEVLLIVDGCERLLRPGDRPSEGRAFGAGFRQLLEIAASGSSKSTILLVGQLWPSELGPFQAGGLALPAASRPTEVVQIYLERARMADVEVTPPFDEIARWSRSQVSALVSLLGGHGYGLFLAGRFLTRGGNSRAARLERLNELQRDLAERAPQKRLEGVIKITLRDLDRDTDGIGFELLDRLSCFLEPVGPPVAGLVFNEICRRRSESSGRQLSFEAVLGRLASDGLLLSLENVEPNGLAYVVHASIRSYLNRRRRRSGKELVPDFALSAHTGGTNGVDPGSQERWQVMETLFKLLCEAARTSGDALLARACGRDAYGILRAQTECSTAARWCDYDRYVRFGIQLATLLKELLAPAREVDGLWSFCEPSDLEAIESPRAPLYIGELSWLYNDVGMALFSEGLMQDAFAVWEQGYEINRALEATQPYGEFVLESLLNLTHCLIELGKVGEARHYLDKAARLNIRLRDQGVEGRIVGFEAFFEHINGNLPLADELYQRSARLLRDTGNRRAMSFFLTLQAGLKVELKELTEAETAIRASRALAEAGDYPDLVTYSRLPEADLLVQRGELAKARLEYGMARREASKAGLRALEALALMKLGELSLRQNDVEGARSLAVQSLKISNELSLGLIATRALRVLALAMLGTGQWRLGVDYLKIVQERARRQQYVLRLREAEKDLQEQGETGD